jgi:CRP/FNR family transcriptional regulator
MNLSACQSSLLSNRTASWHDWNKKGTYILLRRPVQFGRDLPAGGATGAHWARWSNCHRPYVDPDQGPLAGQMLCSLVFLAMALLFVDSTTGISTWMSRFDLGTKHHEHSSLRVYPCDTCAVRAISACASLEADDRRRLTSIMTRVRFAARGLIFTESDPARHLFNLTGGVVKIYKMMPDGRRQITGFLFPGDFLGLVHNETYAYSAEAVTGIELCQFPRTQLEALLDALPHLEHRLLGMASHELAAAQDQLVLLGRKSAQERVASFLLMLSTASERQGHPANLVVMPMMRSDVADYLGLTIETVSRVLTRFKSQRLIQLVEGKQIRIVAPEILHKIAACA